jgi:hypothetical protein
MQGVAGSIGGVVVGIGLNFQGSFGNEVENLRRTGDGLRYCGRITSSTLLLLSSAGRAPRRDLRNFLLLNFDGQADAAESLSTCPCVDNITTDLAHRVQKKFRCGKGRRIASRFK